MTWLPCGALPPARRPECARQPRPHRRCTWRLRPPAQGDPRTGTGWRADRPAGERPLRRGDHRRRGPTTKKPCACCWRWAPAPSRSRAAYDGTAPIAAAHLGHDGVVRQLIAAGAPLDHVNNLHWTALIESIVAGRRRPAPPGHAGRTAAGGRQPGPDGPPGQHAAAAGAPARLFRPWRRCWSRLRPSADIYYQK